MGYCFPAQPHVRASGMGEHGLKLGANDQFLCSLPIPRVWGVNRRLTGGQHREKAHSWRALLDVMLQKLSGGRSWETMSRDSGFVETNLTTTFRRAQRDVRLGSVLERLRYVRQGDGLEYMPSKELGSPIFAL